MDSLQTARFEFKWLDAPADSRAQTEVDWLLSLPPLQSDRQSALAAVPRLLSAPPALGEERAPLGALRYELSWSAHGNYKAGFQRDRIAPEKWKVKVEEKPWGRVDILWEEKGFGLYRLNLAPEKEIPWHYHEQMSEWEFCLTDGLVLETQATQGRKAKHSLLWGEAHAWKKNEPHRYFNPHPVHWASLLCVDSPPFIPWDEIELDREKIPL